MVWGDVMADFFISYNSADVKTATGVATAFRDAGYTVRFAGWEVGVGDDIDQWMWEAIEDCDRCIGIFSPDYLKTDAVFSQAERGTYYWQGMKGMRAAIIPVLARDCKMPKVLDAKVYHDLRKESVDALVAKWQAHPMHQRKRAVMLNRQTLARPVRGREADLEKLKHSLASVGKSAIRNTVVKGGGGIGKTTLARYYIHQ